MLLRELHYCIHEYCCSDQHQYQLTSTLVKRLRLPEAVRYILSFVMLDLVFALMKLHMVHMGSAANHHFQNVLTSFCSWVKEFQCA